MYALLQYFYFRVLYGHITEKGRIFVIFFETHIFFIAHYSSLVLNMSKSSASWLFIGVKIIQIEVN